MGTEDRKIKEIERKLHDEYGVEPVVYVSLEALVFGKIQRETLEMVFREIEKVSKGEHNRMEHIKLHNELVLLTKLKYGVSEPATKSQEPTSEGVGMTHDD